VTAPATARSGLLVGFPPVLRDHALPDVTVVTFTRPVPPVGGGKPVSAPIFSCLPCTRIAAATIARGRVR